MQVQKTEQGGHVLLVGARDAVALSGEKSSGSSWSSACEGLYDRRDIGF